MADMFKKLHMTRLSGSALRGTDFIVYLIFKFEGLIHSFRFHE